MAGKKGGGGGAARPSPSASSTSSHPERRTNLLLGATVVGAALYAASLAVRRAYEIRLLPVEEYGPLVHEFDPYFNLRATEYLYRHGPSAFFRWFDHQVWYPLGRPVGTTIYPGMQFTAVYIKRYLFPEMSINDICVYIPAWFGALQTAAVGLLAYECSLPQNSGLTVWTVLGDAIKGRRTDVPAAPCKWNNLFLGIPSPALECGAAAALIASVLPASLMRSMAGAYDNESVAVFAMCLTFYLWARSLRSDGTGEDAVSGAVFGSLAGLAYFYLAATWGGYIFALNLVGVHAALLVVAGRFTAQVHAAYSAFFIVGTALAVRVPVIGRSPLKSLEQLGPCGVFLGYQLLHYCEVQRKRRSLSRSDAWKLRKRVFLGSAATAIVLIFLIAPSGYFGPLSSRVRGLFVPHTRTGNPLVDSVAEHQKTQNKVYFLYLGHVCTLAPVGFAVVALSALGDAGSFLLTYAAAAYYFSAKMNRLVLLTGPAGAALGGIAVGRAAAWSAGQLATLAFPSSGDAKGEVAAEAANGSPKSKKKRGRKAPPGMSKTSFSGFLALRDSLRTFSSSPLGSALRSLSALVVLLLVFRFGTGLDAQSREVARSLSSPQIVFKGRQSDGREFLVDDYLTAYLWIKENTPEDARIMAWWDYGYQINGVANRTTLADGNTWNHEHIALLGKILTGPIDESHTIARHLADYVLVWAGGGGDDVAKSPHLARIANSVYRDHCPEDPTCQAFGRDQQGNPSDMMRRSLLYNLHSHGLRPDANVNPSQFREAYKSKYGKVRIYEILDVSAESKEYASDPANKLCDVPGSWYCPGQYPPALRTVLERKKDFAQLEDFNRGDADEEYQKQYFDGLENPNKAKRQAEVLSPPVPPPPDGHPDEGFVAPKTSPPSGGDEAGEAGDGGRAESESKSESESSESESGSPKMTHPDLAAAMNTEARAAAADGSSASSGVVTPRKPPPTQKQIDDVYNRWEDSEFATLLWQMVKEGDVEKLENWFEMEPLAPFLRSADGRGPMWWAFENKNQAVVKLLIARGVSHEDRDKYGKIPADLLPSGD